MDLKTAYAPYFKIGAAVSAKNIATPAHKDLIIREFNTLTCENDMKPMFLLNWEENQKNPDKYNLTPAVHFDRIHNYFQFARENNIPMRGHTLVWHNMTPWWFFHENYDENAPLASRETMLARLESYIQSVLTYIQTEYPGIIYAWDVTNEIVDEGDFRKSLWTETVGNDFFIKAFEYAKKYVAPGVKLFYNDYNSFEPWKRDFICEKVLKPLMERGLVDGMGMQSHMLMDMPEIDLFKTAVETYGSLGLTVHLTELDIHNADPSEASMQALAKRYASLFSILVEAKSTGKANIESVTFWNLRDEDSWLTGFRKETSYPLLFHGDCEPKEAYYTVLDVVNNTK